MVRGRERDRDRDDDRGTETGMMTGMTSSAKFGLFVYSLLSLLLASQPLFEPFNQDPVNFCSDWLLNFSPSVPAPVSDH